jgi:hypothetical protein
LSPYGEGPTLFFLLASTPLKNSTKTHLGQSARESPGKGKLSTAKGHVHKKRGDQGDTTVSVSGGDRTGVTTDNSHPTVDNSSELVTNNSVGITLINL